MVEDKVGINVAVAIGAAVAALDGEQGAARLGGPHHHKLPVVEAVVQVGDFRLPDVEVIMHAVAPLLQLAAIGQGGRFGVEVVVLQQELTAVFQVAPSNQGHVLHVAANHLKVDEGRILQPGHGGLRCAQVDGGRGQFGLADGVVGLQEGVPGGELGSLAVGGVVVTAVPGKVNRHALTRF